VQSNGTWAWITIDSVPAGQASSSFTTADSRPLRWASEKDPWLSGFWSVDWAQSYVAPASVEKTAAGTVNITVEGSTPPVYGFVDRARFMGVNLLSGGPL
jgi:hypothetical protein